MNPVLAAAIGLAAGLHTSTWGMYKDSIHEGFTYRRYLRSTILGGLVGVAFWGALRPDLGSAAGITVFFGAVYAGERLLVEYWKTFLREEDQSKYFIPMRFAVKGRVVTDRRARWAVGALVAILLVMLLGTVIHLRHDVAHLPALPVLLVAGSLGGWISALGGAWKDAPHEGFETLKFFRSPLICLAWAVPLALLSTDIILIGFGALGYTIATIETYKTFFFPSRPRGKFAGKPILHPEMLTRRQRFVPLYVLIWLAVLVTMAIALTQPKAGLIG